MVNLKQKVVMGGAVLVSMGLVSFLNLRRRLSIVPPTAPSDALQAEALALMVEGGSDHSSRFLEVWSDPGESAAPPICRVFGVCFGARGELILGSSPNSTRLQNALQYCGINDFKVSPCVDVLIRQPNAPPRLCS